MKRCILRLVVACAGLAAAVAPIGILRAELPKVLEGVGFDQRLGEQVPLDLAFTDETGKHVRLADYFGRGPVILALAYYQCPRLCTLVLNGLVQGMLEMPFTAGNEFQVVTVSFDPSESWQLAASKKEAYLQRYGRAGAAEGWHFLTGDGQSIERLTQAIGFHYRYDDVRKQFVHASGITILTPTGKIARYFYDIRYSGRDLRLGLVEASQNQIGSPVDQVLLYCFHYDPTLGKYAASVMTFVRMGGVLTMLSIGAFVWFLSRHRPARPPPLPPQAAALASHAPKGSPA
jgi:protein SCO1/2